MQQELVVGNNSDLIELVGIINCEICANSPATLSRRQKCYYKMFQTKPVLLQELPNKIQSNSPSSFNISVYIKSLRMRRDIPVRVERDIISVYLGSSDFL